MKKVNHNRASTCNSAMATPNGAASPQLLPRIKEQQHVRCKSRQMNKPNFNRFNIIPTYSRGQNTPKAVRD